MTEAADTVNKQLCQDKRVGWDSRSTASICIYFVYSLWLWWLEQACEVLTVDQRHEEGFMYSSIDLRRGERDVNVR